MLQIIIQLLFLLYLLSNKCILYFFLQNVFIYKIHFVNVFYCICYQINAALVSMYIALKLTHGQSKAMYWPLGPDSYMDRSSF